MVGEAFIIDAVRTPVGRKDGGLRGLRADTLAAIPIRALMQRTGLPDHAIDDVVLGCVTQVHEQGCNIARIAALIAGLPVDVTGVSVNRMCGSSQQAIHFAAMGVASGYQDLVIAGGVESMTRIPMGADMMLGGEAVTPSDELRWKYTIIPQGLSAELVALRYGLQREELDAYSLESHRRAAMAQDDGIFSTEITAVKLPDGALVSLDEGIRRDSTMARLARLRPAFKEDGVITAASSSQISDGAAAVLVASGRAVKEYGLKPRARIISMATAGVDPTLMLTGPIGATHKALVRAGLKIGEIGVVEINEAFASVALGCGREIGLNFERTNVYGGAIALGHPLGASGARLMTTLLNAMERRDVRYGLLTMCIGYGQGTATILDRALYA